MSIHTLAADLGVDPRDVAAMASWLTADGETLDDNALVLDLVAILDPAGQRTGWARSACLECGRLPGPNLVLNGWHPCRCGGHTTTHCRADTGGCGNTTYQPPIDPQRCCSEAPFGFDR